MHVCKRTLGSTRHWSLWCSQPCRVRDINADNMKLETLQCRNYVCALIFWNQLPYQTNEIDVLAANDPCNCVFQNDLCKEIKRYQFAQNITRWCKRSLMGKRKRQVIVIVSVWAIKTENYSGAAMEIYQKAAIVYVLHFPRISFRGIAYRPAYLQVSGYKGKLYRNKSKFETVL